MSVTILTAIAAPAFQPFVVKDIKVDGIQRTELGTVFNYLPVKVGDRLTDETASQAIKALFATGFYSDVRLEKQADTLVVLVNERPVVAELRVVGSKDIPEDQLVKALRENGLAESRVFDSALLDTAVQELKRQYYSRGKYAVRVTATVNRMERNRVSVRFEISEGLTATIEQINLVGNQSFSDSELLDPLKLTTTGSWTWLTRNNQYSKPQLQADTEALRSFYQNQGYLEFNIDSQQVALSDDKTAIFLTTNLTEGQQYKIKSVKIAGDTIVPVDELEKLLEISPGEVFSRAKINAAIEAISIRLGDEGYAFANVNAVPDVDKTNQLIAFTFYIDPGHKIYVRQINISGNFATRDEVVRREIRQIEGAVYSGSKIKRSRERLNYLGYFSEVNIETPQVPSSPDQVDMNITVVEKQTGSIQLGAGYSQTEYLVLSGSISKSNVFGSGKSVDLSVNSSSTNRVYALSVNNPYATPDGISRGFDVYHRHYETSSSVDIGRYKSDTTGGGVRWAVPISEYNSMNYGLSLESTLLTVYGNSSKQYLDFVNEHGSNNMTVLGTVGWVRDTRDSTLMPKRGNLWRISLESGLPIGEIEYAKLTAQQQWFLPVTKNLSLLWNLEGGIASGYNGQKLPFYANFFAGGVSSVRGYYTASLGPQDDQGDAAGGNRRFVTNLEALFPFPGSSSDVDQTVRLSTFLDGGTVWGAGQTVSTKDLRYSYGIAFTWLAPIGPMKFSYANPISPKPNDSIEHFQFSLGRVF